MVAAQSVIVDDVFTKNCVSLLARAADNRLQLTNKGLLTVSFEDLTWDKFAHNGQKIMEHLLIMYKWRGHYV